MRVVSPVGESAGEGLTVCARCHGDDGAANGHVPRLAGQKREYLEHALRSYATAERSSGIMEPVAAELSEREIADLAAFYADIARRALFRKSRRWKTPIPNCWRWVNGSPCAACPTVTFPLAPAAMA